MNNNIQLQIINKNINSCNFKLPKEKYYGNKEYKLKLTEKFIENIRLQKFITQMQFRLIEGEGKAYYYIGVWDNGEIANTNDDQFKLSFQIISYSCKSLNANIYKIYKFNLPNKQYYVFCINSNINYNFFI